MMSTLYFLLSIRTPFSKQNQNNIYLKSNKIKQLKKKNHSDSHVPCSSENSPKLLRLAQQQVDGHSVDFFSERSVSKIVGPFEKGSGEYSVMH